MVGHIVEWQMTSNGHHEIQKSFFFHETKNMIRETFLLDVSQNLV